MGCGSSVEHTKWPEWIGNWERKKEEVMTVQITLRNHNGSMKYGQFPNVIQYQGLWSIDEANKELVFIASTKYKNTVFAESGFTKEIRIALEELEKGDFEPLRSFLSADV